MRAVVIELPEEIADLLSPEETQKLALHTYVFTLVKQGRISVSRGAEILGLPLTAFLNRLAETDFVYYDYTDSDWAEEESVIADLKKAQGVR